MVAFVSIIYFFWIGRFRFIAFTKNLMSKISVTPKVEQMNTVAGSV